MRSHSGKPSVVVAVRLRWMAPIVLAASFAAACSSSGSGGGSTGAAASSPVAAQSTAGTSSGAPLKLYAVAGETGAAAPVAPALLAGLKAAVGVINANGGVLGRKIDVTVANDATDPTKAVSLVQAQISSDKPDLIYGGTSSGEILPVSQVTNPAKIYTISVGADAELGDGSKFPYTFAVDASQASQTASTADYLKSKGYKKIGLIASDDATGTSYVTAYKTALQQAGLTVVDTESFDPTAVDMTAQFERMKSHNPDAMVLIGTGTGAYLIKSREKAGMINVPTVTDAATQSVDWTKATTKAEQKGVVMEVYKCNVSTTKSAGITSLIDSLKKQGVATPTLPIEVYALPSDNLLSWANAATSVNSLDPDKIKAALETGNYTKKYPTAITDDFGWTASNHLSNGEKDFTFIPPTPITNGQYKVSG